MKRIYVKPHTYTRNGKVIFVKGYYRGVVESKDKGRSGEKFKKLEKKVEKEYIKKGYSEEKAQHIGKATAGMIFWKKFGKKLGRKILRREK